MANEIGLDGIDFVEFVSPQSEKLERLFKEFGFSKLMKLKDREVDYFNQNDIHFFLNREAVSHAAQFGHLHGPAICSMGWRVKNAQAAYEMALSRGAKPALKSDFPQWPAIYGIGESLIYFVETQSDLQRYEKVGFKKLATPEMVPPKGFTAIDHLTNNVEKGTMDAWAHFYKSIFGFEEVRYFDIRGAKTGLTSYALRSPCGKFCIPINEASESKSQINEYLEEYKGPGIQHLAFLTENILDSLDKLKGSSIKMLDIDEDYYREIFKKIPQVTEDHQKIKNYNVLVDGDEKGYLLQIFTKNLVGPIFIEIIQRKNHNSFGEGNFDALFRSIERDQMKRGFLT
ncbi:MAG: 4-hydroxyphenylpyruvate dioxygenase [Pseudobdellovibrionaceae bacterium]